MGHVGFVFLADCTPTHIVFGEFFHSSAFISLAEEVGRVQNSRVACEWVIMVHSQDFMSLFEVFGELDLGKARSWE
jgi:hypothetical protein